MKNIITIVFVLLSLWGISSIPLSHNSKVTISHIDTLPRYATPFQQIGGKNAMVAINGGGIADSTFVIPRYTDTSAANMTRTVWYGGSIIFTSSDNNLWVRNITATKWIKINGTPSSGSVDSVTSTKVGCLDIQKYWIGGTGIAYDTIQLFDGLIKAGSITETSSKHFLITEYQGRINCQFHFTPPGDTTLITLEFDTLPRFYTVFMNTSNQAGILVGEESLNATPPPVTPNQQLALGFIYETSTGDSIIPIIPGLGNFVSKIIRDTVLQGAQKYLLDTLIMGKDRNAVDLSHAFPSSDIRFLSFAQDTTVPGSKIQTNVDLFNSSVPGITIPSYAFHIKLTTAGLDNVFNSDKSINLQDGTNLLFPNTVAGNTTLLLAPRTSLIGVKIANPGSSILANAPWFDVNIGGSTAVPGAIGSLFQGDRQDTSLKISANNNLSNGNGAYRDQASISSIQKGRYVLFDTTHTTNRNGIPWRITGKTITLAGNGLIRAPNITATNFFGGRPAVFSSTISAGGLATITILDPGSSYFAGGSLNVDTSGCTIGTGNVLPTATYTVTQFSIDHGGMLWNEDSLCYQSWNGSSWDNMRQGSGGGGSVGTWQQTLVAGSTLNQDNIIDGGQHDLLFHNNAIADIWTVDGSGDNTVRLDLFGSLAGTSGLSKASPNGSINYILTDTSALINAADNGTFESDIKVTPTLITLARLGSGDTAKILIKNPPIQTTGTPTYVFAPRNSDGVMVKVPFPIGGSIGTLQQVLTVGSTLTGNNFIDDNTGTHELCFGVNTAFGSIDMEAGEVTLGGATDIGLSSPAIELFIQGGGNLTIAGLDSIAAPQNVLWMDNSSRVHKGAYPTGGGTPVTSVTGTTNRITSTGGTTPVIDISSTFEALLGKVANPLSQFASTTSSQLRGVLSDENGTGVALFNSSTSATFITPILGTPTSVTLTNGTGLPLTTGVTGVLPIANGGTNNGSLSVTAGSLYYGDGSKLIALAPGTNKQHLIGGTTPSWVDTASGGGSSGDTFKLNSTQFHIRALSATKDSGYIVGIPNGIMFVGTDSAMTTDPNLTWDGSVLNIVGGINSDGGGSSGGILTTGGLTLGHDPFSGTGITIEGSSGSDIITINAVNGTTFNGATQVNGTFNTTDASSGLNSIQTSAILRLGDVSGGTYIEVLGADGGDVINYNSNSKHVFNASVQFSAYGAGISSFDASGNIISVTGTVSNFGSINYQTPTTGSTISSTVGSNIIEPAGTLLALTVNLPSSPTSGDIAAYTFTQAITGLTFSNGTVVNTLTTAVAGGTVKFIYYGNTNKWYKWQ